MRDVIYRTNAFRLIYAKHYWKALVMFLTDTDNIHTSNIEVSV